MAWVLPSAGCLRSWHRPNGLLLRRSGNLCRRLSPTMVRTVSRALETGTVAPQFALPEPLTGSTVTSEDARKANGMLVVFMCNHCPFVIHISKELFNIGEYCKEKDIGMVGISANDVVNYPQDGPGPMAKMAAKEFASFKYLYDETQEVAKAYKAVCTPDIFLFDKDLRLVYHGQLDGARPGNAVPVTGESLRKAIDAMVKGEGPLENVHPSIGCSIKWKAGNEP